MTQTPPETPVTPPPADDKDIRTLAMLAHLLGIVGIIGPLVIWLIKRENPVVDRNGKESVNFQITVLIAWVAIGIVSAIPIVGFITCLAGPAVGIANLILCIMAGIKTSKGEDYTYPFALRLIK